jgi:diguanylate cyclase (GGDEF)-like protein/PAS domain S-box-containing protein
VNSQDTTASITAPTDGDATRHLLSLLGRMPGHFLAIASAHGRLRFVTPSVRDVLGYALDTDAPVDVLSWLHPDDVPLARRTWGELLDKPGSERSMRVRIAHGDGSWRSFDCVGVNALDDPAIDGVLWTYRDITAQLDAERELTANEARLRSMLEQTYDIFLVISRDLKVTWANEQLTKTLGYSTDEFLDRDILTYVHPDDIELAATNLARAIDGDPPADPTVVRSRAKNGEWRWFDVVGADLLDNPTVDGYVLCLRDVTHRQEAELSRRATESRFRSLVQNSSDVILVLDPDTTVRLATPSVHAVFGYSAHEIVGMVGWDFVHPDDKERLASTLAELLEEPLNLVSATARVVAADGGMHWVEAIVTNLVDDPNVGGLVANIRDVTDRVAAQRDAERLSQIFESTSDLVAIVDVNGDVMHVNEAARRFMQLGDDEPLPRLELSSWFTRWELDRIQHEIIPELHEHGSWAGELEVRDPDGHALPVSAQFLAHRGADGQLEHYSTVLRDIRERKAFEARLEHQATHDPLTGLPNRTLLLDRLTMAVARARRHRSMIAVLFLDLDHFKVVNDSHGHSLGDRLLTSIATRLSRALRPDDTVARFGGDEFVVLCEDLADASDAIRVGERIQSVLEDVFTVDATDIYVAASVGISSYDPTQSEADPGRSQVTPEVLLREADAAMYRAKERGRGQIAVFDETLRSRNLRRLDIESSLRRALDGDELEVYFQPIVDLLTGRVRHLEALARWHHPERGLLLPAEFVPIAEETGLIVPLGRRVLESACWELARWRGQRGAPDDVSISVNLSGRQLGDPDLVEDLERVIAAAGLPPTSVVLEITESLLMDDVEFSHLTLERLKRLEVQLAVDDFGTGYSSLSYLRSFPVDLLKVDRSFVAGLGTEGGDEAIVAAIIRLAHTLGLEAVAEGVETAAQLARLRALGCNLAQGFYLAPPMPADEAFASLDRFGIAV